MSISREQVLNVAKLARLTLSEAEIDHLRLELSRFLEHVDQLNELDLTDVPPTAQVTGIAMPMRDDVVQAGLDHDTALAESPRTADGGFAVVGFVEEA